MEASLLAGLNAAQRAAVTSTASILQVLAPPGSGKTKTLTSRVAYLLANHGYKPQNVICCTFTIKASREMRERVRGLVGPELESKLVLGTFHSICRRYLVAYGNLIGIPKNFGIADTSDTNSIIKRIVKRLGLSIDPKSARSKISHHKARGKRLEDLPKEPQKKLEKQEFVTVFHEYETALATSNLLDYDDLLLRCVDLLKAHPNCTSNVQALLIDEFQDTNIVQFELMKLLASAKKRITIVGDPDQSIYGFRSAEIENLNRMRSFYTGTVVINLEENYRSSSAVLRLAQEVIEQDEDRPDKKLKATHCYGTLPVLRRLPNPHEEALWIASEIKRTMAMTGGLIQYYDIAILIRSAYLSLLIEKAFTSSGIPYRMVGGQRFFDRAEIRLVVDYLRTISHPDNNPALLSIINTPSRKIGETTIGTLVKMGDAKGLSLWIVIQKILSGSLAIEKKLSKPAEQDLQKLVNLIKSAREKLKTITPAQIPSKLIELVVSSLDLDGYLKKKYKDDHEDRIENIKELVTHATEVGAMPNDVERLPEVEGADQQDSQAGHEVLAQFLANIVLSTEVETSDKGEDKPRVTISTIHSAKGLEWPVVFIPAVYEGSIPHSRAEDTAEERRLLYVAMTRAQALLTLTFPVMQSREQGESILTQFLPSIVHARLRQNGPIFSDTVIAEMATILRRDAPSQEDLAKSLLTLTDGESAGDDVWPEDGSHRTRFFNQVDHQVRFPGPSGSLADAMKLGGFGTQNASYTTYSYATIVGSVCGQSLSTTMSNPTLFSTPHMSLAFTTAGHVLETSASDSIQHQEKPRPQRLNSAQARNVRDFFSQGSAKVTRDSEASNAFSPHNLSYTPQHQHGPNLPLAAKCVPKHTPANLSGHRLGIPSASAAPKRPRAVLEETSPNRKRYLFLSSSPPREIEGEKGTGEVEPDKSLSTNRNEMIASSYVSKQATTMHTTSMSIMKQNGHGTSRKTLGVRRTMNGWDKRKNK